MQYQRSYIYILLFMMMGIMKCQDEQIKWYTSLRTIFKDCSSDTWNVSGQDDFLEKFRECVQQKALSALDSFLQDDIIPVFDGVDLIRFQKNKDNFTESRIDGNDDKGLNWTSIIMNRLLRVLRTHVFKVNVDRLTTDCQTSVDENKIELDNNPFEGRRRNRRRYNHIMPMMLMGLLLMGSILIPMGFQFLAVLGGKALILAKMALILSSIQGLKKIATNGVNYGLYHTPVAEGWHERSGVVTPPQFDISYVP